MPRTLETSMRRSLGVNGQFTGRLDAQALSSAQNLWTCAERVNGRALPELFAPDLVSAFQQAMHAACRRCQRRSASGRPG